MSLSEPGPGERALLRLVEVQESLIDSMEIDLARKREELDGYHASERGCLAKIQLYPAKGFPGFVATYDITGVIGGSTGQCDSLNQALMVAAGKVRDHVKEG